MNEKDIKILEKVKDIFMHLKNYGWINDIKKDIDIDTDKVIRAIEHLIKAYKELEEENTELKECLEVTSKALDNVAYDQIPIAIADLMTPKALVEEKIADFRDKTVWGYNDWKYDENVYKAELNIIDKLEEELLEKRK